VYVQNSEGVYALQHLTISNIVEPEEPGDPEDPEEPGTPEDPEDPGQKEDPEGQDDSGDDEDDGVGATEDLGDNKIPKTATPWYNYLLIGIILLFGGVITFFVRRKENSIPQL